MFVLNEKFLAEVGLAGMPEDQQLEFLKEVYAMLEKLVGIKLSEPLTDAQLWEFEKIIDRDPEAVANWLAVFAPDYLGDRVFMRIWEATGLEPEDPSLLAEFAATKWLEVNRPDYRDVVSETMAEIRAEIQQNSEAILSAVLAAAS